MHFPTLMRECDAPPAVAELVEELIRRKAISHELGAAPLPAGIADFIDTEFDRAAKDVDPGPMVLPQAAKDEADRFYLSAVRRWGG